MKKMRIIGIVLFVLMVLVSSAFLVSKYLITSGSEVVLSEASINLKGVSDPKRIAYETDNAIIKLSYDSTKKYLLSGIESLKADIAEDESWLTTGKYEDWQIGDRVKNNKKLLKEGEEFVAWLENQKNEEEIDISKTPYINSKIINFDYQIWSALKAGEALIYDKSTSQNIKVIRVKETREKNNNIIKTKYYLPDGRIFFESSSTVYDM